MTTATDITRTYQHTTGLMNTLRYVNDKYNQHTVCQYFAAGEQDIPNVYRHATIEEARATWERLAATLERRGFALRMTEAA